MSQSNMMGYALIQVEKGTYSSTIEDLKKNRGILYALPIQGGDDVIVKFSASNLGSIKSEILEPVCKIPGVLHTSTSLIFEGTTEKYPNSEPKTFIFAIAMPFTSVDIQRLWKIPDVNYVALVTGGFDYLMEILTDEKEKLRLIIGEIAGIDGVYSTETRETF